MFLTVVGSTFLILSSILYLKFRK
ncbi:hypothetical protein [Priestia megaterium]